MAVSGTLSGRTQTFGGASAPPPFPLPSDGHRTRGRNRRPRQSRHATRLELREFGAPAWERQRLWRIRKRAPRAPLGEEPRSRRSVGAFGAPGAFSPEAAAVTCVTGGGRAGGTSGRRASAPEAQSTGKNQCATEEWERTPVEERTVHRDVGIRRRSHRWCADIPPARKQPRGNLSRTLLLPPQRFLLTETVRILCARDLLPYELERSGAISESQTAAPDPLSAGTGAAAGAAGAAAGAAAGCAAAAAGGALAACAGCTAAGAWLRGRNEGHAALSAMTFDMPSGREGTGTKGMKREKRKE